MSLASKSPCLANCRIAWHDKGVFGANRRCKFFAGVLEGFFAQIVRVLSGSYGHIPVARNAASILLSVNDASYTFLKNE